MFVIFGNMQVGLSVLNGANPVQLEPRGLTWSELPITTDYQLAAPALGWSPHSGPLL
jgi:hypothetical protein